MRNEGYWLRARRGRVQHFVQENGGYQRPLCGGFKMFFPHKNSLDHRHWGTLCTKCLKKLERMAQDD